MQDEREKGVDILALMNSIWAAILRKKDRFVVDVGLFFWNQKGGVKLVGSVLPFICRKGTEN